MNRKEKAQIAGKDKAQITCALVGCGRVALKHLKAFAAYRRDLTVIAVIDVSFAAVVNLFKQASLKIDPAKLYYSSLADMYKEKKPDLVIITTPSGSHAKLAQTALQNESHVLVEKPMTLSLNDADKLIFLAKAHHRLLAVGHIYRYFPLIDQLRADLVGGHFGDILSGQVVVFWGHDQTYYDAAPWRGTWQEDGGVLMNQCVHALDLMIYLIGSRLIKVHGWIDRLAHRMEAEDYGLVKMQFENGAYGLLEGSTAGPAENKEASFTIRCQKGTVYLSIRRGKPSVRIIDPEGKNLFRTYLFRFLKDLLKRDGLNGLRLMFQPHTMLYRDLVLAIREQGTVKADGKSGREAVEAVLASYASALDRRTVRLPLSDFQLSSMHDIWEPDNEKSRES